MEPEKPSHVLRKTFVYPSPLSFSKVPYRPAFSLCWHTRTSCGERESQTHKEKTNLKTFSVEVDACSFLEAIWRDDS